MRAEEQYSATRLASGAGQLLYVAKLRDLDAKECVIACIWGRSDFAHVMLAERPRRLHTKPENVYRECACSGVDIRVGQDAATIRYAMLHAAVGVSSK